MSAKKGTCVRCGHTFTYNPKHERTAARGLCARCLWDLKALQAAREMRLVAEEDEE